MHNQITIENATENNLQDVSLIIPHYKLIVVTGVSGSGKSSLVHDVINREGQRLFLDNFTGGSYQAAKKMSRPKVKRIEGLFPVVSVDQNFVIRNARSTVGTLTELYDYLRLLFARLGQTELRDIKTNRSLFSFNTPTGYCPVCKGLGVEDHIDPDLIIEDGSKSLRDGALNLTTPNGYIIYSQVTMDVLDKVCRAEGFSVDIPWNELTEEQKKVIWHGSEKIKVLFGKHPLESRLRWTGITAKPREEDYYKGILTIMEEILKRERNPNIMRFVRSFICPSCNGKRLNDQALSFTLWGKNIDQFIAMNLRQLHDFFFYLQLSEKEKPVAEPVVDAILKRLSVLRNLGLDYLTLNRESTTLSGGESQRIRLANQTATGLRNVLYLLDEPSAGLHPADHHKLLGVIRSLVNNGNTVIVVEHDEQTIHAADHIIDIGPGPGKKGGNILFNGPSEEFLQQLIPGSITSQYLHVKKKLPDVNNKKEKNEFFEIVEAGKNNLQHITVRFQMSAFNVITGVSGSGKSSLTQFLLEKVLPQKSGGTDVFRRAIHIDQSPIGRTPNSNPATYTGLSDHVRDLFAALPESKAKGFKKGQFSFVVKGGRCEVCNGAGVQQVGMHFLGNVQVVCEECEGRRFTEETLGIRYNGKNIFEILELSIEEAHEFFHDQKKITAFTSILLDLGLGYIKLGQPSTTLSGGEAQRVKLATELSKSAIGKVLYILDEPTTGLHLADVEMLLKALRKLIEKGHTILAIEHHPDFILQADRVVDLGPGSGDEGGRLVFEGSPLALMNHPESLTGKELKKNLQPWKHLTAKSPIEIRDINAPIKFSVITTNNLKSIDVSIPLNAITAITGVSGSGRSSLVFDTIYAESQRRFMDGMSSYFRQFIGKTGNPQFEFCEGITPAIRIQKKNTTNNPRSTVGTFSGIYDLYRLLFSRLGKSESGSKHERAAAFSFNNDEGACSDCKGIGTITRCDENKLITDISLPLTAGALDGTKTGKFYGDIYGQYVHTLLSVGNSRSIDFTVPFRDLSGEARQIALHGCGEDIFDVEWKYKRGAHEGVHQMKTTWPGFCGLVEIEYERKHADYRGEAMLPLMKQEQCQVCHGYRLKPAMLVFLVNKFHIGELSSLSADDTLEWLDKYQRSSFENELELKTAFSLVVEIQQRINSLVKAGLGYIAPGRTVQSLSGGEFQRLKLAALTRSSINGVTYMLDEPSFGLHQRDVQRMTELIDGLHQNGNTILMVELSPLMLAHAHHVIEMGPQAGIKGGNIIYRGNPDVVIQKINSITSSIKRPERELKEGITVIGANANNLKQVNATIPAGGLTVITGVSGSGKTSLLYDVLYKSISGNLPVNCKSVSGKSFFNHILYIEQDVPAGMSQSVPLTWLGLSESLKKIFASSKAAKEKGFSASHFSFHSRDGQCPECKGSGHISVSLDFWSDAEVLCETCKGARFKSEVLEIKTDNLSIADVLSLSFAEAAIFFKKHLPVTAWKQTENIFTMMEKTGLNYLCPGQPLNTMSTGELQRLKLVSGLSSVKEENVLCLFDEPTGGLHPSDTLVLLNLFNEMIENGASIVCVTHDSMLSSYADYLIELGPGGGSKGGEIIYANNISKAD